MPDGTQPLPKQEVVLPERTMDRCGAPKSAAPFDLALSFYRDQSAGRASEVDLNALPLADVIRASRVHADESPKLQRLARSMRWTTCDPESPSGLQDSIGAAKEYAERGQ